MIIKTIEYYMQYASINGRLEELVLHDATGMKNAQKLAKDFSKLPWLKMNKGYITKKRKVDLAI
jgi:hypothetical protein